MTTVHDAAQLLAELAVGCQDAPLTYAEKTAATDYLQAIGDWVRHNPTTSAGLIGGGVGAGLGGAHAAIGNMGLPDERKRSLRSSILTGGLAGGALGVGGQLASQGISEMRAHAENPAADSGDIHVPGKGWLPKTRVARLKQLEIPSARQQVGHAAAAAEEFAEKEMPLTHKYLPWMAGADAALNLPYVGATRISPENLTGTQASKFLMKGVQSVKGVPEQVVKAITNAEQVEPSWRPDWHMGKPVPAAQTLPDMLTRAKWGPSWAPSWLTGQRNADVLAKLPGKTTTAKATLTSPSKTVTEPPAEITRQQVRNAVQEGFHASPEFAGRSMRRVPFTSWSGAGPTTRQGAVARLLGYGALHAADYLLGSARDDAAVAAERAKILSEIRPDPAPAVQLGARK